ncbi:MULTISPECIES: zincin-like metallopeptidase domain-containing protein [unclassified Xanthobacter]|uniref:zincin-like metallopeptidase domain-containing protein n=1 Tax=unclassified Xanthobacter TaxID=2623496 RepID=UPI003F90F732
MKRDLGRKTHGDAGYAREELGSAFLAADLGLAIDPRDDAAADIDDWLKVLKGDKRAVFQAASHAEQAVAFLHGLQPGGQATEDDTEEPEEQRAASWRRPILLLPIRQRIAPAPGNAGAKPPCGLAEARSIHLCAKYCLIARCAR